MKRSNQKPNVASLGTILGIWAHPDDETWASAGVMSQAIANGQRVACVTVTKGDAGKTADPKKWPQRQLGQIRQTEIGEALSIVGVHELHWLDYADGTLDKADQKAAVERLVKLIDEIKPDTIITFEPAGITGHDDHKTICAWSCAAAKRSNNQPVVYGACETGERYDKIGRACSQELNIYFNTDQPFVINEEEADLTFNLSRAQARQKLAALKAHQSQMTPLLNNSLGRKYLKKLCEVETFIKLS